MFNSSSKYSGRHKNNEKGVKERLFRATDFQSLMYPCFFFCRILGIFPYKLNASTFEISKPQYILSTVIICICCVHMLLMLNYFNTFLMINMIRIPVYLEANCFYIFGGFIAVVTYILSGPRMHLLQSVLKISSRLPPKSYQKLSRLIHTKDIFGFFYLAVHALTYYSVYMNVSIVIFSIYITMMMFLMDMLYINCVCILKACFESVNKNLANMQEFMVKNEEPVLALIYHKQQNSFLLLKLKALRKYHLEISDTVRALNMIFSLQLLATIVMTFGEVTYVLYIYNIFIVGLQLKAPVMRDFQMYGYFIPYMIHFFIKIILMVWACETNKNKALQVNTSIYDVFNGTTDEQIKTELQLFSMQILHCENIFSGKGLTVDAKLLTAIVSGITTYILISMQFVKMQNFCDQKISSNITQELTKLHN